MGGRGGEDDEASGVVRWTGRPAWELARLRRAATLPAGSPETLALELELDKAERTERLACADDVADRSPARAVARRPAYHANEGPKRT